MTTKSPIKVFIATPCFGAQVSCYYTLSLLQTTQLLEKHGIGYMTAFLPNQIVTRARNLLTKSFLDSDCTHLFFIDADIQWNPEDVLKLINHDKNVIIGLYPNKCYKFNNYLNSGGKINNAEDIYKVLEYSTAFQASVNKLHDNALMEVKHGATGFMMIKKDVIKQLTNHVDPYITPDSRETVFDIFNCKVINNEYLTEDYYFCHLWRDVCNGKIWCDLSICLNHEGWHSFSGNPLKSFTVIKQ